MIHFQLVTQTGMKFDQDVYEIILPTLEGQIGVLTDHMPLISVVTNGVISVRRNSRDQDSQMDHFATYGGVIEVADNKLRVLVDEADNPDEINEGEAKKAYELAKKMKAEAKDQISLSHAQALIDRQAVRLQVSQLRRHTQPRR
ncbi:MAG TPA: ATP synthase F1 subunit epsilon [Candidatus Saccharimonadales bacterium]|jgi:F-type H+-transporting ATPase subunit epsilon|nr:ATP synthase F1 subunit epsilon [Candidatus Saccharimonadales bacterium]